MKKIISFALSLVLIFSLAACGKKNSDIETVKDYYGGQKTSLNLTEITEVRDFSNGYAWVLTSDTEWSLIDTSGKVIYTSTGETHDMSKDACYVEEYAGDDKNGESIYNYKIINKEGKVVASSADGKFDEILAAGDNLFFVHKYESGIDVSGHLYGTINEKGEFVNQLRECPYGQVSETDIKYIGGKAFRLSLNAQIYMSSIDTYISGGINKSNKPANIGDTLYIYNYHNFIQAEGSDTQYYDDDGYKNVAISPDGKIEKAPDFDAVINGMLVKKDYTNQYVSASFTDPATGKTSVFSKYDVSEIYSADNNFLLELNGKDGNKYFTVIDKNCNMLFEPVMGTGAEANDNRLVLSTDEGYSVLDYTGKVIIPVGTYSSIRSFNSGIAWAKNSSDQYVGIDVNGKVVIS